jgi:hypothetical protein
MLFKKKTFLVANDVYILKVNVENSLLKGFLLRSNNLYKHLKLKPLIGKY